MPKNAGVEVKQSKLPRAGNGLFARQAFSPGDTIVSLDRSLVTELEIERMLDTCAWCCQRGATDPFEKLTATAMGLPNGTTEIKSCTGCQRVGYCAKSCQSKAWKHEHKYECKIISVEGRPDLPPQVRGTIKILGRLKADPKSEMKNVNDVLDLWPASDAGALNEIGVQNKQRFKDFDLLGTAGWHYSGYPKIDGLDAKSVSTGMATNVLSNSFTLSSPLDSVALGIGFDPLLCSANHSCDPNAVAAFNQPGHELRALRTIKPGEEIFIKYAEVTNPFGVRQAELKERYFFTCQCAKCQQGVDLEAGQFLKRPEDLDVAFHKRADTLVTRHASRLSNHLVPGSDIQAQKRVAAIEAEAYAVHENKQSTIDEVRAAIQMCINSKMWGWAQQPVPLLCRRLFSQYFESGSIYKAFRLGCKLHFEILPALYPQEFYPDRLINAWVVSTLINVLSGPAHQELYQELAQGGLELRLLYFGFLFYLQTHTYRMFGLNTPFGTVIGNTYKQIMAGVSMTERDIKQKIEPLWPSLKALASNVSAEDL
ncbi:SET domain-containing protein [Astrocystis sublimbata]|nr:SET domain-containing protein [Astrocystis sublimbata]